MRRIIIAVTVLFALVALFGLRSGVPRGTSQSPVASPQVMDARLSNVGTLPLRFEANRGQTDGSVRFLCRAGGGRIFIQPAAAVMVGGGAAVRMSFLGGDPGARVVGADELPGCGNYLVGDDRSRWVSGVPGYRQVISEAVYPGIDVGYRGQGCSLEYDFIVAPGANPGCIRLGFEGAEGLEIDEGGNLVIQVGDGEIVHRAPRVYQDISGEQAEIPGRFVRRGELEVGFEVEAYDPDLILVVDPVIEFATYLGGNGGEVPQAIAIDAGGDVYVAGYTTSTDFPTTSGVLGPVDLDDMDAFVTKLDLNGNLVYSTYIGGSTPAAGVSVAEDNAIGLVLDGSRACIAGLTTSQDFPTGSAVGANGPFSTVHGGKQDAFVCILNELGDGLVYSTLFGGAENDYAHDLAFDPSGRIYVAGGTRSVTLASGANLATPGAYDESWKGSTDVLLAVIDPAGGGAADLHYATYLGSLYTDRGWSLAVDQSFDPDGVADAYIVGDSVNVKKQPQFPTTANAFLPEIRVTTTAIGSAYLSRISPGGNGAADLVYSTFFKNPDTLELLRDVAAHDGKAYVAGSTSSSKWPTTDGAFSTSSTGHSDAVVSVIDTDVAGEAGLVYSTYLGGSEQDNASAIAVDPVSEHVYVSGWSSQDYPGDPSPVPFPTTPDAFLTTPTLFDVFLAKLDPAGNGAADLLFSTLIGGGADETAAAMSLGGPDDVYLAGHTASGDFPVTNGTTYSAGYDGFVMRVTWSTQPMPPADPTDLVATAVSSSAIVLSWTDNAGDEDGFEIEHSPDGSNWTFLVTKGPDVTNHDDTGLDPQATWYYRVRAFNGAGASGWSNVDGATTFGAGGGPAVADGEIPVSGTVTGSYPDTHVADSVAEEIEEVETGGKPSNRITYLEHRWTFTLPAPASSGDHQLDITGLCRGGEDTFVFDYSTDGQSWFPTGAVISTLAWTTVSGFVDGTLSGTLYVRVLDTDQTPGTRNKDTVSIDFMQIVTP